MTNIQRKDLASFSGSKATSYEMSIIQQGDNYLVSSLLLHRKLKSATKYSMWIKRRIEEYGFESGKDYFPNLGNQKRTGIGGDRKSVDYLLTIDTAKELAMLERNEIGRQIRRYFIRKEKDARASSPALLLKEKGDLFKGLKPERINGRKMYHYLTILERCGYSTNAGSANNRKLRYPQHFVRMGHPYYITEEFALHLRHQKQVYENRQVMKAMQPVLPFDFGGSPLQLQGGAL